MLPTNRIWVTFKVPGIHCYPDAPEDVAYLRSPHRHLFHFKAAIQVFHDEREIEFHQFLRFCKSHYASEEDCSNQSCETLARTLVERIRAQYPMLGTEPYLIRAIAVEVSEDGECGAIVFGDNSIGAYT